MAEAEMNQEESQSFNEDFTEPMPPNDIVSYNELRSCADLFRLHTTGKLEIKPDFQRDVVWKKDEQTRFIDSLVKQLPIPSMCFSLDYKTQRWKVIDGLQRMSSIAKFLGDGEWILSDLPDIDERLRSKSNLSLKNGNEEQRLIYSIVEDVSIPITVLRCDYNNPSHMRYLFTIFHRLNAGGVRLTNQEIRNCIYSGVFNDALKDFDENDHVWGKLKRRIWGSMDRFRSVEILLRMLAFSEKMEEYDGNLARFLNDYMHKKLSISKDEADAIILKVSAVSEIAERTLSQGDGKKLTLTLVEAVLVAIFRNLQILEGASDEQLQASFEDMSRKASFAQSARYAVSSADNVKTRLNDAIASFRI